MEESVRSMLVYKKQAEQLRQEKAALTIAFENRCQQYQSTIGRLNQEIVTLRHQLERQHQQQLHQEESPLPESPPVVITTAETHNALLQRHVEEARKQYEKCLDDVANQVVRALVAQKGLKEEVSTLNARIHELETQNGALTAMLMHQLQSSNTISSATHLDAGGAMVSLSEEGAPGVPCTGPPCTVFHCEPDSDNTSADVSPANLLMKTTSLTFRHCNSFNSDILEDGGCGGGSGHCADVARMVDEDVVRSVTQRLESTRQSAELLLLPKDERIDVDDPSKGSFSAEDKQRHRLLTRLWTELKGTEVTPRRLIEALSAVDATLWVPPKRPVSLNLQIPVLPAAGANTRKRTRPVLYYQHGLAQASQLSTGTSSSSNGTASITTTDLSTRVTDCASTSLNHRSQASDASTTSATITTLHNASAATTIATTTATVTATGTDESPESSSGNRDEGYSTMSSDVQTTTTTATIVAPSSEVLARGLEELREVSDEIVELITNGGNEVGRLLVADGRDPDVLYIPVNLLGNLKSRNSFPPGKDLFPFQHIMRSFSDSHLCIKITTSGNGSSGAAGTTPYYTFSSPISSSPSILLLDLTERKNAIVPAAGSNPLRRAKATTSLLNTKSNSDSAEFFISAGVDDTLEQYGSRLDAEYIHHWLRLDETQRLQHQQAATVLELEYDTTELEDWSLSLSMEDLKEQQQQQQRDGRKSAESTTTPGQISLNTLPSIQENNALELEEDANECLWNNPSYLSDKQGHEIVTLLMDANPAQDQPWPYAMNYHLNLNNSPDNSWSSHGSDCCNYGQEPEPLSKRSSAALSGCSDDTGELPAIGTDFTRDFYRLVKYESTKSLASTSSRSIAGAGVTLAAAAVATQQNAVAHSQFADRETALQNVLTFIAEQQKYVQAREDSVGRSGSLTDITKEFNVEAPAPVPPTSEIVDLKNIYDCDRSSSVYTDQDENYVTLKQLCAEYTLNEQNATLNQEDNDVKSKKSSVVTSKTSSPARAAPIHEMNITYADEVCLVTPLDDATENCSPICERPVDICSSVNVELTSTEYQNGVFSASDESPPMSEHVDSPLIQSTASTDSNNQSESLTTSSVSTPDTIVSKIPRRKPSVSRIPISPAKVNGSPTRSLQHSHSPSPPSNCTPPTPPTSEPNSPKISSSKIPQKKTSRLSPPKVAKLSQPAIKKPPIPPPVHNNSTSRSPLHNHVITAERLPQVERMTITTAATNANKSSTSVASSPTISAIIDGPPHRAVSFHERATSKDVIDELNRMIRNGGDDGNSSQECLDVSVECEKDCKSTGWIHVERDVDLTDPKMRANLLDVMMASVSSDSSPTSSCGGSVTSESVEEPPPDYGHLHRIHKFHRQKKVNAIRPTALVNGDPSTNHPHRPQHPHHQRGGTANINASTATAANATVMTESSFAANLLALRAAGGGGAMGGHGVISGGGHFVRPTIIGRAPDLYLRYGDKEREAVASFDFLDEISVSSSCSPQSATGSIEDECPEVAV